MQVFDKITFRKAVLAFGDVLNRIRPTLTVFRLVFWLPNRVESRTARRTSTRRWPASYRRICGIRLVVGILCLRYF